MKNFSNSTYKGRNNCSHLFFCANDFRAPDGGVSFSFRMVLPVRQEAIIAYYFDMCIEKYCNYSVLREQNHYYYSQRNDTVSYYTVSYQLPASILRPIR